MHKKFLYLFLLLLFVAVIFYSSAFLQSVFSRYNDVVAFYIKHHPVIGILSFLGLAALSVMLGPFTSIPLVPPAITAWGVGDTFLFLFVGWLLGDTLAFVVGRFVGYPLVAKIMGKASLDESLATLQKRLSFLLLFLFRLATPSETGYVFGILKYSFKKYFLITALVELPFAILVVYASDALLEAGWQQFVVYILIWVVIILLAIYEFRKRFK
jgi:uncharacterized membrane protein YdjX (TVP38/TMEM64 family)